MDAPLLASLASGVFIGGAAGYLGSLMLSRRMALVAGPLGHLTLPGIALAMLHGFDVSLGAFPFVILGIVLIWAFELRTRLPMEALTALVFATGVAVAFLFLPIGQAEAALVGDVTKATLRDTVVSVGASVFILAMVKLNYASLVLINISEDVAVSQGIHVRRLNLLYLFLIALIVALGVKVVGGLLTAALVAIPPAVARNVAGNMRQYALGSSAVGAGSAAAGIALFHVTGYPAGPLVILVNAACFLVSLAFARK